MEEKQTERETRKVVQKLIGLLKEPGEVSDGYHTFNELYDHRIRLYIELCRGLDSQWYPVWKSKKHSDGRQWEGWFVLGIHKIKGRQITYHLPMEYWHETDFAEELENAPEFDGHTSSMVLDRLKLLPMWGGLSSRPYFLYCMLSDPEFKQVCNWGAFISIVGIILTLCTTPYQQIALVALSGMMFVFLGMFITGYLFLFLHNNFMEHGKKEEK